MRRRLSGRRHSAVVRDCQKHRWFESIPTHFFFGSEADRSCTYPTSRHLVGSIPTAPTFFKRSPLWKLSIHSIIELIKTKGGFVERKMVTVKLTSDIAYSLHWFLSENTKTLETLVPEARKAVAEALNALDIALGLPKKF